MTKSLFSFLVAVAVVAATVFAFTGCDPEPQTVDPTYTVSFNSQGGSAVAAQSVAEGQKVTKPTDPTRDGYTFLGWFREAAATTAWNFDSDTVTANVTLHAKWVEDSATVFTVTFDSQGGPGVSALQVPEGETIPRPADPVWEAHTFLGWFADKALATPWDFDTAVTKNITLYAGWEQITHTVTFHYNNGAEDGTAEVMVGALLEEPAPPAYEDHAFGGWFLDDDEFTEPYDFETPVTADLDLYAKWIAVSLDALRGLAGVIDEISNNSNNYEPEAYNAFMDVVAQYHPAIYDDYYQEQMTPGEIAAAYNALSEAIAAVDGAKLPHRPAVHLDLYPEPFEGTVYAVPGEYFSVSASLYDENWDSATDGDVLFKIEIPAWMTDTNIGDSYFSAYIGESAPEGASVSMTVTSAENPSLTETFNIVVIADASEFKARFIELMNALPDPEDITQDDYDALLEADDYLYNVLQTVPGYNVWMDEDPAMVAALEKFDACWDVYDDLPIILEYSFSGNTATITQQGYDDDSGVFDYVADGSFPNGSYTSVWMDYDGEYEQMKLELYANGTFATFWRDAEDGNGTNAGQWEQEEYGTYTFTGNQSAGGTITLTYTDEDNSEVGTASARSAKTAVPSRRSFSRR